MKRKRNEEATRSTTAATDDTERDALSSFEPGALERALAPATASFASATPFVHVQLGSIFKMSTLLTVRAELALLQRTFKETDLFKVHQSGDLANLDEANAEHVSALPATIALRAALYSDRFRSFIRSVTGCAPLTAKQDCSCNVYRRGGHLLCHDDVIGTRCVSYILYLSRPNKKWKPRLGGALELYTVSAKTGVVRPTPVHSLSPEFGTLVLFTVQPGLSFHAVQEVASSEDRLSISGWFHAATPPEGADSVATLAQLKRGMHGGERAGLGALARSKPVKAPRPRSALTSKQERRLLSLVNPAYLQASTIAAVHERVVEQGAALLASFLQPPLAAELQRALTAADHRDGLHLRRIPKGGPPYAAGTQSNRWKVIGPPQLCRFMRYRRLPDTERGTAGDGEDTVLSDDETDVGGQLEQIRVVMRSAPFVQLLSALTGLTPASCASEVRRFRPGLDYTLAHVGTIASQRTLDATLAFVNCEEAEHLALWESGDVGGFECHVQTATEDDVAAEVYRADESSAGVTSIHAQSNALSLVVRGTDTMKFIKYVSAAAPGSRWDVAAEYSCVEHLDYVQV